VAVIFAAACAGFLVWNWAPARIFMGDAGSGFLGFFLAVLALAAAREHPTALLVWLVLGGVFFVDATVTLARRLLRGERVQDAHRSHAYQWLSRRWRSHSKVTLAVLALNGMWLVPAAWVAARFPAQAGWVTLLALLPVTVVTVYAGAGKREHPREP
jgi:Fuc2NAc and GlcNAc transferase